MFSLVIVIISIALVGLLAVAVIYYGGSSISAGGDKAQIARTHNESVQIAGAAKMHYVEKGRYAENIDELVSGEYLKASPGTHWSAIKDAAVLHDLEESQCQAINTSLGISSIPSCSDPSIVGKEVCCTTASN